ncbi:MAG: histidine triad nucleotide-binding protein [Gammaproteobacteria bacterium]|nr:MAG: histidine triad nucleotide-binding protein [Gammaproteobacteria bacterium]
MTDCLFCKICDGEIPADTVFENDDLLAFRDVNPQAPTHILIIPKKHISTINDLAENDEAIMGKLCSAAKSIAAQEGVSDDGYRLVVNCNARAGQTVFHIHMHLLAGRNMTWPPG